MTHKTVDRLTPQQRAELFTESNPWRVTTSLADYPLRPVDEWLVAYDDKDMLCGCRGLLYLRARVNEGIVSVLGFGGFYVKPTHRGTGVGDYLHATMFSIIRKRSMFGALAFCEPALVSYYAQKGARDLGVLVRVKNKAGDMVPSPQPVLWWDGSLSVPHITSLDLMGSYRW